MIVHTHTHTHTQSDMICQKMKHLDSVLMKGGTPVCVQSYCTLKVSHLSSVHCQDASSFGRSCHFVCVCVCVQSYRAVKV